jgi:SAM-dependent methyltransferase
MEAWLALVADGVVCGATAEVLRVNQHQLEIQRNLDAWHRKPLLQEIYRGFYARILKLIDTSIPGPVVEIGSGIGNLKSVLLSAIATDIFAHPWLDLACDGYELPFRDGALSHVVLFDVFHHLRAPKAFLKEARRALGPRGRVIIFDPFISLSSYPIYGLLHHEPVAWRAPIDEREVIDRPRDYYAAQGNATRFFFSRKIEGWEMFYAEAFSAFHYLLSGGYSKPSAYPRAALRLLQRIDDGFSRWPRLFGGRCLIGLR